MTVNLMLMLIKLFYEDDFYRLHDLEVGVKADFALLFLVRLITLFPMGLTYMGEYGKRARRESYSVRKSTPGESECVHFFARIVKSLSYG